MSTPSDPPKSAPHVSHYFEDQYEYVRHSVRDFLACQFADEHISHAHTGMLEKNCQFETDDDYRKFLNTSAGNHCISVCGRRKQTERKHAASYFYYEAGMRDVPDTFPLKHLISIEEMDFLHAAMRGVQMHYPVLHQIVFERYWQEKTFEQIAEQLGMPPATVRDRLRQAIQMLRRDLVPVLE